MDKPRWFITWILAAMSTIWTHNDSFWWAEAKIFPLCLAVIIIENIRSSRQNEK